MQKVLILFAHPSQGRSEVNYPLFEASRHFEGVTVVDLYAEYPNFRIDIDKEQARLIEHDIIVFMFPLYWYSTPSILKEWQDLVFEHGFAYGKDGDQLKGKTFLAAVSTGGSEDAYQTDGYNHFTLRELLHPLEQTAVFTGMKYLPPFALFSARTAVEEDRVQCHIRDWHLVIQALQASCFDHTICDQTETINCVMPKIKSCLEGVCK